MVSRVNAGHPSARVAAEHNRSADVKAATRRARPAGSLHEAGTEVKRGRRNGRGVPVRLADGRICGVVVGCEFRKRLRKSAHMLRTPPAWCLDVQVLDVVERMGAQCVGITDTETGREYRATIATIRQRGFALDRGYGLQIACPLQWWARDGEPMAEQLALGL